VTRFPRLALLCVGTGMYSRAIRRQVLPRHPHHRLGRDPAGDPDGRILLVGQRLLNADGSLAAGSGRTVLANSANGEGAWSELPAPVEVNVPAELNPDRDGDVCKPYYATGAIG
jgi:hypothetical protein